MITYGKVNQEDEKRVRELWKSESVALGIPWKREIVDVLTSGKFHCVRDDGRLVGFCGTYVLKRKRIVSIVHLVVDKEYRGRGYSKIILRRCYEDAKPLLSEGYKFQVQAKDGMENNSFYDRISIGYNMEQKVKSRMRIYDLDSEKISRWNMD